MEVTEAEFKIACWETTKATLDSLWFEFDTYRGRILETKEEPSSEVSEYTRGVMDGMMEGLEYASDVLKRCAAGLERQIEELKGAEDE